MDDKPWNDDMLRGSGRTAQQMRDAPDGAVFVWCNRRTEYATQLARHLGRLDLRIAAPWQIEQLPGIGYKGALVVDHAAELTERQCDALHVWESRKVKG